jgi:hypothetical protein
MTLNEIELLTKKYADARAVLSDRVYELETELEAAKRAKLRGIKQAVGTAAAAEAILRSVIEEHPELFEKPRTQIFHGIKVGFRKGQGGLDWDDEAEVVERIEKYFNKEAETYLHIKKKPDAEALEDLEASVLKKLGVSVVETGDQVVVKPVDGAVEKLVKTLLKGAVDEATGV